jgi:rhamnosyl/mannosyltransferase
MIMVTSQAYANESIPLRSYLHKVRIVPSGVHDCISPIEEKVVTLKRQWISEKYSGRKIVFSLGRMTYYKGFEVLVESARFLAPNIAILIGGAGELLDRLQRQAERLNVADRVSFLGNVPAEELPAFYLQSDVFCLPSTTRSEAFGLVMVEAMSYAKPVVATQIPGSGVSWVNLDGVTGLNVAPGDPEALADALNSILRDSVLSRKFGEAGRRRFLELFTLEMMIDRIDRIYSDVLARNRQESEKPGVF